VSFFKFLKMYLCLWY